MPQAPAQSPEAGACEQIQKCEEARRLPPLPASFSLLLCLPGWPYDLCGCQNPVSSQSWSVEALELSPHWAALPKPHSWVAPLPAQAAWCPGAWEVPGGAEWLWLRWG